MPAAVTRIWASDTPRAAAAGGDGAGTAVGDRERPGATGEEGSAGAELWSSRMNLSTWARFVADGEMARYLLYMVIAWSRLPSWRWHWPMLKRKTGSSL